MRTVNLISHAATVVITAVASILIYNHFNGPLQPVPVRPKPQPKESICSAYTQEEMSLLNVDLIHTMIDTYKNQQWSYSNANNPMGDPGWVDAQSVWFDLETLKKFLFALEKQVELTDNSVAPSKLGVRIYYATYPGRKEIEAYPELNKFLIDNNNLDYVNRHTVVMIPTIQDESGNNFDFNPMDSTTYNFNMWEKENYRKGDSNTIPNSTPQTILAVGGTYDNRKVASRNHGTLTPPDQKQTVAF